MSLVVDITKKIGDFCLEIAFRTDGNVSGLLGASGSGKSMTLKCISGIVKPDRGKIILNGRTLFDSERKINLPPQQRHIGYLFQNYALFPNMTVRQNILCGMHSKKNHGKADGEKKEAILQETIELMQINGLEERRPYQLSGGQQQRVALARILVGNPDLLILDEPFSALDTQLRGTLRLEMQRLLRSFGKDALLVSHDRNEVYHLCQKIALIDWGKLLVYKDAKELFADPESRHGALLTGCKNVVDAIKTGDFEVKIPAWGVHLTTGQPVRDGLSAVGIRGHYFNPETKQNCFPIHFADAIEEPFEYAIQFRYHNQIEGTPDVWWLIRKDKRAEFPGELGIDPANIMLLYD